LWSLLAWVLTTVSFPVVNQPVPADAIFRIGTGLVGPYVIPFEVASVLLVVALIGAVMIARERHRQR
jgi:NADH:ubiquinone oxidoreductase subunit 6 (subunit J)